MVPHPIAQRHCPRTNRFCACWYHTIFCMHVCAERVEIEQIAVKIYRLFMPIGDVGATVNGRTIVP